MARHVALLRGINLGTTNRISMPDLRKYLAEFDYEDVTTVAQSGNIVLTSTERPAQLERDLQAQIAERFGVDTPVVVRTASQLRKVVADNPLRGAESEPKSLQVAFLGEHCPSEVARKMHEVELGDDQVVVRGREIYAVFARGSRDSALGKLLASPDLGVVATSRNWSTVLKLRDLV